MYGSACKINVLSRLKPRPERPPWNAQRFCLFGMKHAGAAFFFQGIAVTGFGVAEREAAYTKAFAMVNDAGFRDFFYYDFIVDVHIKDAPRCFDVLGDTGRPVDKEGVVPVYL
jgi:hypothetical protein